MGTVRLKIPELMFQPEINDKTCSSIQEIAWNSIDSVDEDIKNDLMKNIVLSGGNTLFEGIEGRLRAEIAALTPAGYADVISVSGSPDRKNDVWKGASILATLGTFRERWITQ